MTTTDIASAPLVRASSGTPTTHRGIPLSRITTTELRKMFDTRSGFWLMLLSSDLRKDAIDLIAALYPNKLETERTEFEEAILQTDFSGFVQPEKAKTVLLSS